MQDNIFGDKTGVIISNYTDEELSAIFGSGEHKIPHSGYDRACVYKSGNQSVASGAGWTSITFDSEKYDTNGLHDTVTNNSRLTIQKDGCYQVRANIESNADDKVSYEIRLYKNGSTVIPHSHVPSVGSKETGQLIMLSITPFIDLVAGDYIEVQYQHDDGSAQNVLSDSTFFEIERRY